MNVQDNRENLAQTAAAALREDIVGGVLPPGTPLREQHWSERLEVSRNTLREAFRILEAQGLIDHRVHFGATVHSLAAADIRELYAIRMTLELHGIRCSATADADAIAGLVDATNQLQNAALRGEWDRVGTLSLAVHRRIVGFIGSPRLDDLFSTTAALARLAFSQAPDARSFQRPWVVRDVEICALACAGNLREAARALELYLVESEELVLAVLRARSVPRPENLFRPDDAA